MTMTREQQMIGSAKLAELNSRTIDLSKKEVFLSAYIQGWRDADQHPQWIPVEEVPFPPKKNKWDKKIEVLIYGLWMGRPTILFGTYHYDTNEWGANGLISDITHWMPVPQLPRKED